MLHDHSVNIIIIGRKIMSVARRRVLLCKAKVKSEQEDEKSYARILESAGFTCDQLSVLRFEYVNLEELSTLLLMPRSYSGLILTSPRCVEALELALENKVTDVKSIFNNEWKKLPVYCVGATTDRLARERLKLEICRGSESGNAKELAKFVIGDVESTSLTKPLLYPCSVIARDTITNSLDAAGIPVRRLFVYQTLPSDTLQADLDEVLLSSPPEFLVLFSPSAVKYVTEAMKRSQRCDTTKRFKFVAIGPVTEKALAEAGLEVYATSNQPEPESLLNALAKPVASS